MKPSSSLVRSLVPGNWTSLIPVALFWGGMTWQKAVSEATDHGLSWNPLPTLNIPPRESQPERGRRIPRSITPREKFRPATVVPDFAPLSALVIAAGELATHHPSVFREVALALNAKIPVVAIVANRSEYLRCEDLLHDAGIGNESIHFLNHDLDSMWVRDYGPLFVRRADGGMGIVDASYSAGSPQERWRADECPILLSQALGLPLEILPIRMQGGNLLSNGRDLLVTSTSLLAENATRGYNRDDLAVEFATRLAAEQQWITLEPLAGDLTAHADLFVSLIAPDVAVVAQADPASDPANARILDAAVESLHAFKAGLEVHRIPLPPRRDGLIRSYNNIVMANDIVLVPTFSDTDPDVEAEVLNLFRRLLPGKTIVPIRSDGLPMVGGLLRCATLGIPAEVDWRRLFSWKNSAIR